MQLDQTILELLVKVWNFALVNFENGRVKTKKHVTWDQSFQL